MRSLKTIHDRSFDFREVQTNPGITQPVIDRLKAFQARSVNFIHRAAHDNNVPNLWVICDLFEGNAPVEVDLSALEEEAGQAARGKRKAACAALETLLPEVQALEVV